MRVWSSTCGRHTSPITLISPRVWSASSTGVSACAPTIVMVRICLALTSSTWRCIPSCKKQRMLLPHPSLPTGPATPRTHSSSTISRVVAAMTFMSSIRLPRTRLLSRMSNPLTGRQMKMVTPSPCLEPLAQWKA